MFNLVFSPTRRYVAICINDRGEHYGRSFYLPSEVNNDSEFATWHFLRKVEPTTLVVGCMSFENYSNVTEVEEEK